jgi:hypothetical protein
MLGEQTGKRWGTVIHTYMLCSVLKSVNTHLNDAMFLLLMVNCMSCVCQSQYRKTFGHYSCLL